MPKYMLLAARRPCIVRRRQPRADAEDHRALRKLGNRLREAGLMHGGHKLTDEPGRVMRGGDGQVRVTDGPYSESKEILGGYYIIEAENYEQALDRARDCPHLDYGAIEVRQVDLL